jgi:hypothetical protein
VPRYINQAKERKMTKSKLSIEQRIQKARAKQDWASYAIYHGEDGMAKALLGLFADPEIDPNSIWPVVADLWCIVDSDKYDKDWIVLWSTVTRGDRTLAMDEAERSYVASRPEEFEVWRADVWPEVVWTEDVGSATRQAYFYQSGDDARITRGIFRRAPDTVFYERGERAGFIGRPHEVRIIEKKQIYITLGPIGSEDTWKSDDRWEIRKC